MLRWILGIVLFLVLAVVGTCFYGYSKLTSGGGMTAVTVATTPERAWTFFTHPDSFRTWQDTGSTTRFSTDSILTVGDTVWLETREFETSPQRQRMLWVLERVEAPRLLVWAARSDSTQLEIIRRTDSLVAVGDSVRIVSVFASPAMDSMRTSDSVGGISSRLLGGAGKVAAGAMRLIAERDLARLKARLDG